MSVLFIPTVKASCAFSLNTSLEASIFVNELLLQHGQITICKREKCSSSRLSSLSRAPHNTIDKCKRFVATKKDWVDHDKIPSFNNFNVYKRAFLKSYISPFDKNRSSPCSKRSQCPEAIEGKGCTLQQELRTLNWTCTNLCERNKPWKLTNMIC